MGGSRGRWAKCLLFGRQDTLFEARHDRVAGSRRNGSGLWSFMYISLPCWRSGILIDHRRSQNTASHLSFTTFLARQSGAQYAIGYLVGRFTQSNLKARATFNDFRSATSHQDSWSDAFFILTLVFRCPAIIVLAMLATHRRNHRPICSRRANSIPNEPIHGQYSFRLDAFTMRGFRRDGQFV